MPFSSLDRVRQLWSWKSRSSTKAWAGRGRGWRGARRRGAPRPGLAEELAPQIGGREDAGQPALLLLGRAVGQQRGPSQVDGYATDQLGGPGPGQLLLHQVVLGRSPAPAPVLVGPGHAHPASRGEAGVSGAQGSPPLPPGRVTRGGARCAPPPTV